MTHAQKMNTVLRLTKKGSSPTNIARRYGTSDSAVCKIMDKLIATKKLGVGTKIHLDTTTWDRMTEFQREQYVLERYIHGDTITEMARALGTKTHLISCIIEDLHSSGQISADRYRFEPRTDIEPITQELDEYSAHYAAAIYEDDRAPDVRRDYPQWPICETRSRQQLPLPQ